MKKYLLTLFAFTMMIGLTPQKAGAANIDFDYSGQIDNITGEAQNSGGKGYSSRVTIDKDVIYNMSTGMYVFTADDNNVSVSVCNGMIVAEPVDISIPNSNSVNIYMDGKKLPKDTEVVSDPGNYVITSSDSDQNAQLMSFQIVNDVTGLIKRYTMPEGFVIDSVTYEGKNTDYTYSEVEFNKDGEYYVSYHCIETQIQYDLMVTIDHNPPNVEFKGLGKNNKARGPVTIKGLSDDYYVSVTKDGKDYSIGLSSKLTESGVYDVVISDNAGNKIEKKFEILIYLNLEAWLFLGLMFAAIAGVIIALIVTNKKMRVR